MGFFAPSSKPVPRTPRSRTTHEVLPPNPSIAAAISWLMERPEFSGPPDSCLIVARKTMQLRTPTMLTLCRFRYADSGQTGRVVIGATPWAFLRDVANQFSHDDYLLAYCGWHYLYGGQDKKPITTRITRRPITVPNLRSATATAEYRIGSEVVVEFEGIDSSGEPVAGATDGTKTTSIRRAATASGLPWVCFLLGSKLNSSHAGQGQGQGQGEVSLFEA